jgi:hypothetical protein
MPGNTLLQKKVVKPLKATCDSLKINEIRWRFYSPKCIDYESTTEFPYLGKSKCRTGGYSKILIIVGNNTHEITYVSYLGNERKSSMFDCTSGKYYKTFAEINTNEGPCFDEKGKPRISILYGNERIHLGHLF